MSLPMGHLPVRPLSYENKDLAVKKELIVDWNNGELYINTAAGNLVSITQAVFVALKKSSDLSQNITIVIPGAGDDGGDLTVNLEEFSKMVYKSLDEFRAELKSFVVKDPETGEAVVSAGSIKTDENHQFVTTDQINNWNSKATKISFNSQIGTTWTGSEAPFTQTIQLAGIKETDEPTVDVLLSDNISYKTSMDYLDAWGNIYRVTTQNDSIKIYSSKKTDVIIPIKLLVVR